MMRDRRMRHSQAVAITIPRPQYMKSTALSLRRGITFQALIPIRQSVGSPQMVTWPTLANWTWPVSQPGQTVTRSNWWTLLLVTTARFCWLEKKTSLRLSAPRNATSTFVQACHAARQVRVRFRPAGSERKTNDHLLPSAWRLAQSVLWRPLAAHGAQVADL